MSYKIENIGLNYPVNVLRNVPIGYGVGGVTNPLIPYFDDVVSVSGTTFVKYNNSEVHMRSKRGDGTSEITLDLVEPILLTEGAKFTLEVDIIGFINLSTHGAHVGIALMQDDATKGLFAPYISSDLSNSIDNTIENRVLKSSDYTELFGNVLNTTQTVTVEGTVSGLNIDMKITDGASVNNFSVAISSIGSPTLFNKIWFASQNSNASSTTNYIETKLKRFEAVVPVYDALESIINGVPYTYDIQPMTSNIDLVVPMGFDANKYNGGVLLSDGRLACVNSYLDTMAFVEPTTGAVTYSDPVGTGVLRFSGGVLLPNGEVACIPYRNTNMAFVDPTTGNVTYSSTVGSATYRYSGGVLLPNGKVACIPLDETTMAFVDPTTGAVTYSDPVGSGLADSFYGGVLLPDGRVACIPHQNDTMAFVDPSTGTVTYSDPVGSGTYRFNGGVLLPDGRIACIPYQSDKMAFVDPVTGAVTYSASVGSSTFRFRGGILLPDGRVACIPNNYSSIAFVNPVDGTVTYSASVGGGGTFKHYGGVLLPDGRMACIPNKSASLSFITFDIDYSGTSESREHPYFNKF